MKTRIRLLFLTLVVVVINSAWVITVLADGAIGG
jgi:hypothetical protein